MPPLKNNKHERFCIELVSGKTQKEAAIIAGYKPKWVRSVGSRLSTNVDIKRRIEELQRSAADNTVVNVIERKRKLSEIARKDIPDKVKTTNIITAISELNKMDHIYRELPQFQDNRQINIIVHDKQEASKVSELIEGITERTKKLEASTDDGEGI